MDVKYAAHDRIYIYVNGERSVGMLADLRVLICEFEEVTLSVSDHFHDYEWCLISFKKVDGWIHHHCRAVSGWIYPLKLKQSHVTLLEIRQKITPKQLGTSLIACLGRTF